MAVLCIVRWGVNMKVNDYKELLAYQKAYELVLLIYRMTCSFPKEETYGLSCQIRRAAVSVPSNIAEDIYGAQRNTSSF